MKEELGDKYKDAFQQLEKLASEAIELAKAGKAPETAKVIDKAADIVKSLSPLPPKYSKYDYIPNAISNILRLVADQIPKNKQLFHEIGKGEELIAKILEFVLPFIKSKENSNQ